MPKPPERWALDLLDLLMSLPAAEREEALRRLPPPAYRTVAEAWFWKAHAGQEEPPGPWLVWLLMAGRGFGKTRAGAEWVLARARQGPEAQIALVGATLHEVEQVMVLGPSGLIASAGSDEAPVWQAGKRTLRFASGARAFAYSADRPESLRGPEHHFAWCDEAAKWPRGEAAWDNLLLGLRCGEAPRALVTTTPRPVPLVRRILAMDGLARSRGRTDDNLHSAAASRSALRALYAGTRLGRQELEGELIEDVAGALWRRALIEQRRSGAPRREEMVRIVVGVDPPASAGGVCGISVCGKAADGTLYVLADASESGLSPEGWAQQVARA
ncbi:MAG: hypothetical protein QOI38_1082, partial [Sphingomonadales bacterium]|nr:hypothetical protein [Sphingomonadales bacterium]